MGTLHTNDITAELVLAAGERELSVLRAVAGRKLLLRRSRRFQLLFFLLKLRILVFLEKILYFVHLNNSLAYC